MGAEIAAPPPDEIEPEDELRPLPDDGPCEEATEPAEPLLPRSTPPEWDGVGTLL